MRFVKEIGGIIDREGHLLHVVEGTPGMVVFPQEILHQLHKDNPGIIQTLAHTHPSGMTELSGEDISTLKAQALWMYPYPIRMSTITWVNGAFVETRWIGFWEAKELWEARGKKDARKFQMLKEVSRYLKLDDYMPSYQRILIEQSYEKL